MESNDIKSMSIDELWNLKQEIVAALSQRLAAEKARLDERLRKLAVAGNVFEMDRVRRPYPKVLPKYQNPESPGETWSGRGKQPHWLRAQLRSGKKIHDFLIDQSSARRRRRTA